MSNRLREKYLLAEIERLKDLIAEIKKSKPYGLVWEDKSEQFEIEAANAVPVLKRKGARFSDIICDPLTACNILIEGDNYHALSVLMYTHRGKIDLIYIDPPYNTGHKDFRFNDNYVEKTDTFRHSKWLSFMAKRLAIARDLLAPTGFLIASIDDVEQANLQNLLSTNIFSPDDFVATIPVIKNLKGNQDQFGFAGTHDYLIVFQKSAAARIGHFKLDEEDAAAWQNDDIGYFKRGASLKATGNNAPRHKRPNLYFPIFVTPSGSCYATPDDMPRRKTDVPVLPLTDCQEMSWRWSKSKVNDQPHDLIAVRTGSEITIYKKQRPALGDLPTAKPKSIFYRPEYSSGNGTAQLKAILGGRYFNNPKPTQLIVDLVELCAPDNGLILDFFAGSGTTAHAVLELNKKDGGNRRFILCTNNENNICEEVTYKRIKRVMTGYTKSNGDIVAGLGGNLTYLKTDFVSKEMKVGLSDEAKLELTRRANLILALRELTFSNVAVTDYYEIDESPTKLTGIYFSENKRELTTMLDVLAARAVGRSVTVYIFAWEKGAYKKGVSGYPHFRFEDIPEPLVDVYQSIGL